MPEDLSSAVSLNGVVMNSARVVGPALAGVLIVTIGTTACFAINALSYLAVIAALVMLRPLRTGARRRATGGVREGLRYAASRQQLWLPLVMMSLVGLLAFNFPVGSIITGAIISAAGPRAALLTGAAACLAAAAIAARVHTPPHPDAALTDLSGA